SLDADFCGAEASALRACLRTSASASASVITCRKNSRTTGRGNRCLKQSHSENWAINLSICSGDRNRPNARVIWRPSRSRKIIGCTQQWRTPHWAAPPSTLIGSDYIPAATQDINLPATKDFGESKDALPDRGSQE